MPAPSPYADILVRAAQSAARMPHLANEARRDVAAMPSDAAQRARDARLAASIVASVAFRGITQRRGDYLAIHGAPITTFSTKR